MNNENLDDLIANFYDADQVAQVKEDICKGDEIIASGGILVPDAAIIGDIKNAVSTRLTIRRRRRMNTISLRTAVAAMIAIIAFIGINKMVHHVISPVSPGIAISSFWGADAMAGIIADELDEIENTIVSISLDEVETESDFIIDNMELEINEAGNSFWRG